MSVIETIKELIFYQEQFNYFGSEEALFKKIKEIKNGEKE